MAGRTKRTFSETEKKELLGKLGDWRHICVAVCTKAPIGGDAYRAADILMGDIDKAVERLTGNREHFHLRPPTTGANKLN